MGVNNDDTLEGEILAILDHHFPDGLGPSRVDADIQRKAVLLTIDESAHDQLAYLLGA
jgi:hypothetical protein